MKKVLFVLFFIMLFLNTISGVKAKVISCIIEGKDEIKNYWWTVNKFKLEIDTSEKTIRGKWYDNSTEEINAIGDLGIDREYDAGYFIDYFEEKCPKRVKVCKFTKEGVFGFNGMTNWYAVVFQDFLVPKIDKEWLFVYRDRGDMWLEMFKSESACIDAHDNQDCEHNYLRYAGPLGPPVWFKINKDDGGCITFEYSNESDEEVSSIQFKCDFYYDKVKEMKPIVEQYNQCKNGLCNISSIVSDYNKKRDELKTYCKSYISIMSVSDSCMDICLNLSNNLKKDGVLIEDNKVKTKCSMSEDIVSMIYNVFKWMRYIAPVLVIILSILDFIKALAAQNDDDMKKAQGKFVKRLIVASLLFLIPLIINFTLKTFGFYHSGCDITDLF